MITLSIKINQKSKKGRAFLEFAQASFSESKDVNIVLPKIEEKADQAFPYNPEFVEKVLKSASSKNRTRVTAENLWESI